MEKRQRTRFRQIVGAHLSQVRGSLFLASICIVGFTLTGLLGPWPLKIIFDHVLLDKPLTDSLSFLSGVLESGKVVLVVVLALAIVVIAVLQASFSYAQLYITSRIGHQMVYRLRTELFAHLQRLSLSFHNRTRCGELLTKVAGDTNILKDVFADSILTLATHLLTLTGMFAVMFVLNWRLSLIPSITVPVLFVALYVLYRRIKVSARKHRRREGQLTSRLSENLSAVPLVQAFGREQHEAERFETESAATLEEGIRIAKMEAVATRIVEIVSAIGTGAVILFGSLQTLKGQMMPGEVLIFASYLASMHRPMRNLARLSARFSKAAASAERIMEILETEPEIEDAPDAMEATGLKGEIAFEHVCFDYGDGKSVLDNVSFTIASGERVALVGPSGSGKSTIVSLFLRLYDPKAGRIVIDGVDIKRYKRDSLRRAIGVVQQSPILLATSVRENIAYGKLDATEEEIIAAAKAANAHDFILALDEGYETLGGERGATLSGGERQRIAIARALIRNAPILILDEPTTGLDVESKANIQETLKRLMAGKTCLLITHDLMAAAEADRVLVLEEGQIVERPTRRVGPMGSLQVSCESDPNRGLSGYQNTLVVSCHTGIPSSNSGTEPVVEHRYSNLE
jgi:ATP-binding cassette subfamily B protein